jgi:dsRNA-specific ribonuclease
MLGRTRQYSAFASSTDCHIDRASSFFWLGQFETLCAFDSWTSSQNAPRRKDWHEFEELEKLPSRKTTTQDIASTNPVQAMLQLYQELGISSLNSCMSFMSQLHKGQIRWTCKFQCPISGRVHSACDVLNDDNVGWSTKKAAQKACAVNVLNTSFHGDKLQYGQFDGRRAKTLKTSRGVLDVSIPCGPSAHFSFPKDHWKTARLVPQRRCSLFELIIMTNDAQPLSLLTQRVGLLYPECLSFISVNEVFETHFGTPREKQLYKARLIRATPCTLVDAKEVAWLQIFNRIVTDWKNYGLGRDAVRWLLPERYLRCQDFAGHATCMLVPLSPVGDPAIDWIMVKDELENNVQCCLLKGSDHPIEVVSTDILRNRILMQGRTRYLYRVSTNKRVSLQSDFNSKRNNPGSCNLQNELQGCRADLGKKMFEDNYWEECDTSFQSPYKVPIPTVRVDRLARCSPFCDKINDSEVSVMLEPESTFLLPTPLGFLHVASLMEDFMADLERKMYIFQCASHLEQACEAQALKSNTTLDGHPPSVRPNWKHRQSNLARLLLEATTVHPQPFYERLEFLGDAVLGFCLALNAMTRNASLEYDWEELGLVISNAGKNKALAAICHRADLEALVTYPNYRWKSAYRPGQSIKANVSLESQKTSDTSRFAPHEIVESVIASVYLSDMAELSAIKGSRLVTLMNLLQPPMNYKGNTCFTRQDNEWFTLAEPCIKARYDFSNNLEWSRIIDKIGQLIDTDAPRATRLQVGYQNYLDCLAPSSSAKDLQSEIPKILLQCALFDDSLADEAENVHSGAVEIALVRDTLGQLGGYSLQLAISEDAFRRFPEAEPRDLHLVRACVSK